MYADAHKHKEFAVAAYDIIACAFVVVGLGLLAYLGIVVCVKRINE